MTATEAEVVGRALRGQRNGRGWLCRCPSHDDRSPSLSVATGRDGRLLVHCHAGCDPRAVLAELRQQGILEGRDQGNLHGAVTKRSAPIELPKPEPERPFPDAAAKLWAQCRPIEPGTIAADYLEARGCALPHPEGDLRWHPSLRHPDNHIGPALVALVTDAVTVEPMTLHRTWIEATGKAAIDRPRLLWAGGRKKGGCIRLWPDDEITLGLAIAEGVETTLTAARVFPAIWSTVDAGNLAAFPVLPGIDGLTIIADHDKAGIAAAEECARRWAEAGVEVRLWSSPVAGEDLNDWGRP